MSKDEVDSDRGVDQLDTEMPPEMKQIQEFMNTTFPGDKWLECIEMKKANI